MPMKDERPVIKGRAFRLTRDVTGEHEDVLYGTTNNPVVVTGAYMTKNAFEVMPLDLPRFMEGGYYTPFMVTLDDVISVEEGDPSIDYAFADKMLREYDSYITDHKNHVYGELDKLVSTQSTREQIEEFLDGLVELKGGYFAFGYVEGEEETF